MGFKVIEDKFYIKTIKGLDSVNNIGRVKALCIVSYDAYICVKFHENAYISFSYTVNIISMKTCKGALNIKM